MTKIRPIVRDAFRVDELHYQLSEIDVCDGQNGMREGTLEEVNEKCDDAYLIGEAENLLDLAENHLREYDVEECDVEDYKIYKRDKRQLVRFIKKWKKDAR